MKLKDKAKESIQECVVYNFEIIPTININMPKWKFEKLYTEYYEKGYNYGKTIAKLNHNVSLEKAYMQLDITGDTENEYINFYSFEKEERVFKDAYHNGIVDGILDILIQTGVD